MALLFATAGEKDKVWAPSIPVKDFSPQGGFFNADTATALISGPSEENGREDEADLPGQPFGDYGVPHNIVTACPVVASVSACWAELN